MDEKHLPAIPSATAFCLVHFYIFPFIALAIPLFLGEWINDYWFVPVVLWNAGLMAAYLAFRSTVKDLERMVVTWLPCSAFAYALYYCELWDLPSDKMTDDWAYHFALSSLLVVPPAVGFRVFIMKRAFNTVSKHGLYAQVLLTVVVVIISIR